MMILAYLRMKFSSLKMNSERSLSVPRQPRRSSSAPARPPPPADMGPPPSGTASRTCRRAPDDVSALTAALRLLAPGIRSSVSASSPSDITDCAILEQRTEDRPLAHSPVTQYAPPAIKKRRMRFNVRRDFRLRNLRRDRLAHAAANNNTTTTTGNGNRKTERTPGASDAFNFAVVVVAVDDEDALGASQLGAPWRVSAAAGAASVTEYPPLAGAALLLLSLPHQLLLLLLLLLSQTRADPEMRRVDKIPQCLHVPADFQLEL